MGNEFPKLGIKTAELKQDVEALIDKARWAADAREYDFGAVNWGDLGVADIEYRLSMLSPADGPSCIVMIEEASPGCGLERWLNERIEQDKYPRTYVECEW